MEHKYPVRPFGISYLCDDCKDVAVNYKELKYETMEKKIEGDAPTLSDGSKFYYKHICPKCGKEYRLDKRYPYTVFEPIPNVQEEDKWWDIFKRK